MAGTTGTAGTAGTIALESAYEKALAKRGWRRGGDKALGLCEMARAAMFHAWMESADGYGMEFGVFVRWLVCGEGMRISWTLERFAVVVFDHGKAPFEGTLHWLRALSGIMHGFAFDVLGRFYVLKMDGVKHPEDEAMEWLANKVGCTERVRLMSQRAWIQRVIEEAASHWSLAGLMAGLRTQEGDE